MPQRRLITACALAILVSLSAAVAVSAHARVKVSTPSKGEVIVTPPSIVDITFTQEIQKVAGSYEIKVVRDRGASVTAGDAKIDESDRTKLSVALSPSLTQGRYVVNWKNVSDADGDPAEGAFSFYLGTQPNAVDLANDAQLEQIGFEAETPGAGSTRTAAATSVTATPAATGTRAAATRPPSTAGATATAAAAASSGGGDSNTSTILFVVGALLAGVVFGFVGWRVVARRRS